MREAVQSTLLSNPRIFSNRIVGGQDANEGDYPFMSDLIIKLLEGVLMFMTLFPCFGFILPDLI